MMETSRTLSAVVVVVMLLFSSMEAEEIKQGHWGSWGPVSPCSVTCGSGTTGMERVWIPGPNDPPTKVPFTSTQVFSCTDETYPECPQNGTWSGWGSWSGCTKACGGGIRERHRDCRGQMYGGKPCEGEKFSKEDCSREPCPPLPKHFDIFQCRDDTNFTCSSKKMCILLNQKCDNIVQCHDGSDEDDCTSTKQPWGNDVRYDLNMGRNSAGPTFAVYIIIQLTIATNMLLIRN